MEGTLQILDDKMGSSAGTTYEALQYLQSFIARKSKSLGKDGTSDCVFHGATILMNRTAYDDAGTLLEWFIDSDDFNTLDKDLDRLLMEETGLPVVVAEEPLTCVARGGGRALELMDAMGGDFLSTE